MSSVYMSALYKENKKKKKEKKFLLEITFTDFFLYIIEFKYGLKRHFRKCKVDLNLSLLTTQPP